MKYIALLRGINVGKQHWIKREKLKASFEALGYANVTTYINSGNLLFESDSEPADIRRAIETTLKNDFGFDVPALVKTESEMKVIADAIPSNWQNDSEQRTDVAYLFTEIDSKNILDDLPLRREYIDVRYVKGAIFWNIDRKNYNKSHLNKLIGHRLYQLMTVRNVNTARVLAGYR